MATTTRGYRYPASTDAADVPADIHNLASDVDADVAAVETKLGVRGGSGSVVTSLPGSPADGQVVDYLETDKEVIWRFRYRAAATSSHKWEFVGGAPLFEEIADVASTGSGSYVDLPGSTGPGPLTVPLAGDYLLTAGFRGGNSQAGAQAVMTLKLGSAAAADTEQISAAVRDTNVSREMARSLAAGIDITAKYEAFGGGTATFVQRWMKILPVRVG